jgi:hypothetical protein
MAATLAAMLCLTACAQPAPTAPSNQASSTAGQTPTGQGSPSSSTSLDPTGSPTASTTPQSWSFNFVDGADGFTAIFADYHDDGSGLESYQMDQGVKAIPDDSAKRQGLYIAGANRSDDLFMGYWKGLELGRPNATVSFDLSFQLATDVAPDEGGIGGDPNTSVYIKAGLTTVQPVSQMEGTHYRLNIDAGIQSESGADMKVIGDMSKPTDSGDSDGFVLKELTAHGTAKTDASGRVFLIIGSDSGFEGFTSYYLTDIKLSVA